MYQVVKRDKAIVEFDIAKIIEAIRKSFDSLSTNHNDEIINLLALRVCANFETKVINDLISVEDVQDSVEFVLIQSGFAKEAKSYILYRKQREKIRGLNSTFDNYKSLIESYLNNKNEAINDNLLLISGLESYSSGKLVENYFSNEVFDEEINRALESKNIAICSLNNLRPLSANISFSDVLEKGVFKLSGNKPGRIDCLSNLLFSSITIIAEISRELDKNLQINDFSETISQFVNDKNSKDIKTILTVYFDNLNEIIFNSNLDKIYFSIKSNAVINLEIIQIFNENNFESICLVFSELYDCNINFTPLIIANREYNFIDQISIDISKINLNNVNDEIFKISKLVARVTSLKFNLIKNLMNEKLFPYLNFYTPNFESFKMKIIIVGYDKLLNQNIDIDIIKIVESIKNQVNHSEVFLESLNDENYHNLLAHYDMDVFSLISSMKGLSESFNLYTTNEYLNRKSLIKLLNMIEDNKYQRIEIIFPK